MLSSGTKHTRIVFFGNERIATGVTTEASVLRMLITEGYEVAAVVINHHEAVSRKQRPSEISLAAEQYNLPVLAPRKMAEVYDALQNYRADIGVLVAFGKIVPESIIDLFPLGIVNIHPSLLPKHRGPTPLESVLLAGETETGVSLMHLAREMDAGPVYAQTPVTLNGTETKQELADTMLEAGCETLRAILPKIIDGSCSALPQSDANATYDELITKADGLLDFHKSAARLEREIRAYAGWPSSRMVIAGKDAVITKAHVIDEPLESEAESLTPKKIGAVFIKAKQLCLQTADGILVIDELKPAGKAAMPSAAFLAGYGKHL